MSRLRTYGYMNKRSEKVINGEEEYLAVYRLVDERSGGRCEVNLTPDPRLRCTKLGTDHHHLLKPRRSNHDPDKIVHLCHHHHDRCEWPYKRGRLVIGWPTFTFHIRYAADKFDARMIGAPK